MVECMAEETGEFDEHGIGGIDIAIHEGADAIEGIEEEVGVELHAEGVESGGGEAGFEFEDSAFAFLELAVIGEGMGAGEDDPVDDDIEEEGGDEDVAEDFVEGFFVAAERDEEVGEGGAGEDPEEGEDGAGDEVEGDAEAPVWAGEAEAAGEGGGWEGEETEEVPVGEGAGDGGEPGDGSADLGGGEVVLAGEGEAEGGPEGEPGDDGSRAGETVGARRRHEEGGWGGKWKLESGGGNTTRGFGLGWVIR